VKGGAERALATAIAASESTTTKMAYRDRRLTGVAKAFTKSSSILASRDTWDC
jgi:hypothetical protein